MVERRDRRGVAGGLLAEGRRGRVARHDLGEEEHDERDAERQQHERRKPAEHEAAESTGRKRPPARGAGRVRRCDRCGRHSSRAQNGLPTRASKRT